MNREVVGLVQENHPKYVLWAAFGEYYEIEEATFDAIRRKGAQVVGWFFDDEVRFDYYSRWWIPHLDYFVTNDIGAVAKYKELGGWATQAICTGPSVPHDWSNMEEKYDVCFIGSLRANREQYLKVLKERNIPVHLFGTGGGRFLPYEEMLSIFSSSKINLNFSSTFKYMRPQIKARVFEVCLAGGFLLTEHVPGIETFFEIDKEIVCFRTIGELVDKITYYLNHDEERRAIAHAGWEKATREYTSLHIMSRVLLEIEEAGKNRQTSEFQDMIMPMRIRRRHSIYAFQWGRALLEENSLDWRDELRLSLTYYPFNIGAWYYYMVGLSPAFLRSVLIKLYGAQEKLQRALLSWLATLPYLKEVKRRVTQRLLQV